MEVVKAGTSSARSQASDDSEQSSNNEGGASDGQPAGGYELEAAAAMAVPGDLTIRISVASCQGITVDKISSQVWRDAKLQIGRLLDESVAPAERQQIAASLTDMCDRMETKNILETNIPRNVRLAVQLGPALAAVASDQASGSDGFNDRLRDRIAEFNHGLVSLADGISRLKNKLLTLEYCAPSSAARLAADSAVDAHVCRSIHKNFRRILQKESRFLRDELFAAKETIYRLERRAGPPRPDEQQGQLVPYHEYPAAAFHPAAYFNVEHAQPPPLWPHCAAAAPGFVAYPAAAAAAVWERVYAHPELGRQLHCYSVCDPGLQCLPAQQQPVCGSSGALCVPQPSPQWTPIERGLTDDGRRDERPEEAKEAPPRLDRA